MFARACLRVIKRVRERLRNASTPLITGNYRNFHDFPRYLDASKNLPRVDRGGYSREAPSILEGRRAGRGKGGERGKKVRGEGGARI